MKQSKERTNFTKIRVQNVQVRVQHIIDGVMATSSNLLELFLQDIDVVPQECSKLASDPRVANLKHLDLSCNHIGFIGLCNLLKKNSYLGKLEQLKLYSCGLESDFDHRKMIEHIKLNDLQSLNLSHNNLCDSENLLTVVFSKKFGLIHEILD